MLIKTMGKVRLYKEKYIFKFKPIPTIDDSKNDNRSIGTVMIIAVIIPT